MTYAYGSANNYDCVACSAMVGTLVLTNSAGDRQDMTFLLTPTCIRLNAHMMAVSKILPDSPATCAACLRVEEVASEGKAVGADPEQTK